MLKSIFLFLVVILFSTTIHAEVEVLCLGEGECISVKRNYIHPGSLSNASYQQKLDYLEFLNINKPGTFIPYTVKPQRGRLLMFPPTWQYYHAGLKPKSGKKYLLHSYCHYG